jgi:hypothetical protein
MSSVSLSLLVVWLPVVQIDARAEDRKWESLFNAKGLRGCVAVHDVDFIVPGETPPGLK